jgi:hypothetical protein
MSKTDNTRPIEIIERDETIKNPFTRFGVLVHGGMNKWKRQPRKTSARATRQQKRQVKARTVRLAQDPKALADALGI